MPSARWLTGLGGRGKASSTCQEKGTACGAGHRRVREPWAGSSGEGRKGKPQSRERMFEPREPFCTASDNVIMRAHYRRIKHTH